MPCCSGHSNHVDHLVDCYNLSDYDDSEGRTAILHPMNLQEYLRNPMQAPVDMNEHSFPMEDEVNVHYWREVVKNGSGAGT